MSNGVTGSCVEIGFSMFSPFMLSMLAHFVIACITLRVLYVVVSYALMQCCNINNDLVL